MTTRILVTGASGLLGGRLAEILAGEFEVVAARHTAGVPSALRHVSLDLVSPEDVAAALEAVRPEAVVHAAALADADRCERDPRLAAAVNVQGSSLLADECARRGVRLILISTDLVLSGDGRGWREGDAARPCLEYGRTKLAAEGEVLRRSSGSAVVRVALVHGLGFGPRGTASESVVWALRAGRRLRLFSDQFRTPVDAASVAAALAALLRGRGEGLYHLGGPERVSRYELGRRVALVLGFSGEGIEAATQSTSDGAPRPRDVSLDSTRARVDLGFDPAPLDAAIRTGRSSPPGL